MATSVAAVTLFFVVFSIAGLLACQLGDHSVDKRRK